MTNNQIIPVFFATDENYVPYLGVCLHSLISHASPEKHYEIYILHDSLSPFSQQRLQSLATENVSIAFAKVSDYLQDYKNLINKQINFWSMPTYYRLSLPLIAKNYSKIIYCDCDTIFLDDIAELYDTDLSDKYLAAVSDADIPYYTSERRNMIKQDLGLSETDTYFNAGVLLLNIERIRQDNLLNKFIKLRETIQNLPYHDQDILNAATLGQIKFLPPRYNYQWHLEFYYPKETSETYKKDSYPLIIHYTSPIKPWNDPKRELADKFWLHARQTPFYEEILFRSIATQKLGIDYSEIAASVNRKDCLSQLRKYKLCTLFLWGSKRRHYKQKVKNLKQLLRKTEKASY